MKANKTIILIISHGFLAQALVETVELIVGKLSDVFYINFPKEKNLSYLEKNLGEFVTRHKKNNIIIFIDICGGSCLNVCYKYLNRKNIRIFSGINLPILLETVTNKDYLSFSELINKIKEKISSAMIDINEKADGYKI